MTFTATRERLRSRRVQLVLGLVLLLVLAATIIGIATSSSNVTVSSGFVAGTPEGGKPVQLDTSVYLPETTPAPAVLLSQGFGGDKHSLDSEARSFAQAGYIAMTYTARGFGQSGGLVHFAAPGYEVRDGRLLISRLAARKDVLRVNGKPQIATAGSSYGGGLSLLIAAADQRVGAVAADITWNDLSHALFPNFAGSAPGVFKRLWAGSAVRQRLPRAFGCPGRDRADRRRVAEDGRHGGPDRVRTVRRRRVRRLPGVGRGRHARTRPCGRSCGRPVRPTVLGSIKAPTLLTQGEDDSLFPLSEADANARGLAAHHVPVRVVWRQGGHDSAAGGGTATSEAISWVGDVFAGRVEHRAALPAQRAGGRRVGRHRRRVPADAARGELPGRRRASRPHPDARPQRPAAAGVVAGRRLARRDHHDPRTRRDLVALRPGADRAAVGAGADGHLHVGQVWAAACSSPGSPPCDW